MERDAAQGERVGESASEEELETSPTSKEQEPTSDETPEVLTKEEVEKLIQQAKAEVQSAKDREVAAERRKYREALAKQRTEMEQERLRLLEEQEKQKYEDTDPDLLKELHDLRRRVYATVAETGEIQAHGYAYKLARQHGVDAEALLECASPEEMETKAMELAEQAKLEQEKQTLQKLKELEEEIARLKKAPQKIDSSVPSATGVDWRELTPEQKIKTALEKSK
jgi:hypothetical protein